MLETFVAVCESCRSNLTVPVTAQGRVSCCPRCGITFEIPRVAGLSEDTATEDAQRTIFDEPGSPAEAKPVLLPVPEIGPLPPMRPAIVDPPRPKPVVRTPPKVRDADVFGPIPQSFQEAEPAPRDDTDDDVPRAVRKWDRQRDTTRWGTDLKPDPFTTSNPELLRSRSWIDPNFVRWVAWLATLGFFAIIFVGVARKLLNLYGD